MSDEEALAAFTISPTYSSFGFPFSSRPSSLAVAVLMASVSEATGFAGIGRVLTMDRILSPVLVICR
ncbi:hypothetical protein D3C81_2085180 [compost metagenome]